MAASGKYFEKISALYKGYAITKSFNRHGGMCRLISADEGSVKVEFDVLEEHTNSMGTLHGGLTASLIDLVTTTAILSSKRSEKGVSVDLHVIYMAPAKIGDTIIVSANVVKFGNKIAFTTADLIRKKDDILIAKGVHTKAFPTLKKDSKL